ncbi:hypothetical protein [Bacillus mobilis]|uniref:hypothetical protein n=1 Tax=Bacillus mobilis TaxID=2026190 RepID=UPI002E1A221B|nr:hypothetical protein [Bacillus mobilis]MED0932282.1 hypothetical protein [Bacillus mobilis]MED0954933.1 hypothetical protein [Bacillus mobilis]
MKKSKKGLGLLLVLSMGISLNFSSSAAAETNRTEIANKIEIKHAEDGRIQGINSASKLNSGELNRVLGEMGFSFNEISNMQEGLKKEIVEGGGKKSNLELIEEKQEYTSLDGKDYVLNEQNKQEIQNIKERDANTIINNSKGKNNAIQYMNPPSAEITDDLTFNLFAIYQGQRGSDYVYKVFSNQMWTKRPYWQTNDMIGIVWESNAHALAGTESARQYWTITNLGGGINEREAYLSGDRSSLYGTKWKLPYRDESLLYGAYTSQQITIPKSYRGSNATVGAGFAHPWFSYNIAINFGPGAISFSDAVGDKKSLRYNINVGS